MNETASPTTEIVDLSKDGLSKQANQLQIPAATTSGFGSAASFVLAQRQAMMLATSDLAPKAFKGNAANCMLALDIAQRIGASPLMVMQSLYIVHGSPAWSGQFVIAAINQTNRFTALRFKWQGEQGTDDWGCRAWAKEKSTGEILEGPLVTIAMSKAEGWYSKSGSKWQTMPELMMMYRSGAWFGRTHAPEVTMGLPTVDEAHDIVDITPEDTRSELAKQLDAVANQIAEEPNKDESPDSQLELGDGGEPIPATLENMTQMLQAVDDMPTLDSLSEQIEKLPEQDRPAAIKTYSERVEQIEAVTKVITTKTE